MLYILSALALLLYGSATYIQAINFRSQTHAVRWQTLLGFGGLAAHTLSVYVLLHSPSGVDLSTGNLASLVTWLVALITLLSSLRLPIHMLFLAAFPMAIAAILYSLFSYEPSLGRFYDAGIVSHVLLSVLAYSLFTVATVHACFLYLQDKALKQRHTQGLIRVLPPLQTMERLLFEVLSIGLALLTGSLITGFLFVEDLLEQHLAHKTVFSVIAWFSYSILLSGHIFLGWRSRTAVRWAIGSFIMLAVGFFGTKLILDWFIQT